MATSRAVCHNGATSFGSVKLTRAETMVVIAFPLQDSYPVDRRTQTSRGNLVSSQVSISGWKVTSAVCEGVSGRSVAAPPQFADSTCHQAPTAHLCRQME